MYPQRHHHVSASDSFTTMGNRECTQKRGYGRRQQQADRYTANAALPLIIPAAPKRAIKPSLAAANIAWHFHFSRLQAQCDRSMILIAIRRTDGRTVRSQLIAHPPPCVCSPSHSATMAD